MMLSTPSLMTAIFDPSGDHAGPAPTRESIEKCSAGVNQRSSPALSADIDRILLVPSRKRDEYGASAAMTTRLPSADHVGVPGPNIDAWMRATAPVTTSTTEMFARRQIPSTSRKAIRFPSGDHAAPIADV
jgi:hypothetical protein